MIEEQIKEILDRHHVDAWGKAEIIKELSNLLTKSNEEAVRGFVEFMYKEYRTAIAHYETNADEHSKIFADILQQQVDGQGKLAEEYLTQQSLDKGEDDSYMYQVDGTMSPEDH